MCCALLRRPSAKLAVALMEESVFDVLDELEYETNVNCNTGHINPRPDQPQLRSNELLCQSNNGRQQYIRNQWPQEWENEANDVFPLDDFDQRILDAPTHDRQYEAIEGRARLTLPIKNLSEPGHTPGAQRYHRPFGYQYGEARPSADLGRSFTHDENVQLSPSLPPLSSSPSYKVSRRAEHTKPLHSVSYTPPTHAGLKRRLEEFEEERPRIRRNRSIATAQPISLRHAPPIVQGIELVPVQVLPDRIRSIFPFPLFNAVQSKCFPAAYDTDDNFVLSAPTGSGKTAVLELAICRLVGRLKDGNFKIIYQAPTKALCAERFQDWQRKFGALDLQCAQLTGDTGQGQLRGVQSASIIITTPEKWDSMTRKWKDHQKLMKLIKLFLIDEVHILKDERGATLEAVVSRMKSVSGEVRFIALSATVPNCGDIATWLGKNHLEPGLPANMEVFGEEFRPVKLQKYVCGYSAGGINDFGFDKMLDSKLPEVIARFTRKRPIMVFCSTRSIAAATAKNLAKWWFSKTLPNVFWNAPSRRVCVVNNDLAECVSSGVAFHHGGLGLNDRETVEAAFLAGDISVICCTSTLAVGVNLPCHFVIIKNTVSYQGGAMKEYADLEVMQMLGRAGRPQFDRDALAVIMTRQEKVNRYEKMVSGQETIESCLHLNLIEHLNAEIGLETIKDHQSARRWLMGTFLYVRMLRNPERYGFQEKLQHCGIEDNLDEICARDIALLQEWDLVTKDSKLKSTEFGDAMARYYIRFDTMKRFLSLKRASKLSDILSALTQASEFKELRFRAGEKPLFKKLNASPSTRFPIPVNLDTPAQKVSLIIQSVLGGAELPVEAKDLRHRSQYNLESAIIFQHVSRVVRCIIDIFLHLEDAVASRNALMLARSLGAKAWDDSPLHLKQLDQIGNVAVRKLANAGIVTVEELEHTEPYRIEMLLARNPPFGTKLLERLKAFPKVYVSLTAVGKPAVKENGIVFNFRADFGFLNDKVPIDFCRAPVYICLLSELSNGRKAHFCRISARKLKNGQEMLISALLTAHEQTITTYIMCDEIAGTLRQATIRPNVASSMFQTVKPYEPAIPERNRALTADTNTSKQRALGFETAKLVASQHEDNYGESPLQASALTSANHDNAEYVDIDSYVFDNSGKSSWSKNTVNSGRNVEAMEWQPTRLANGKWSCNHKCKDKVSCKHLCCHEGLDQPPRRPKSSASQVNLAKQMEIANEKSSTFNNGNSDAWPPTPIRNEQPVQCQIEEIDLTEEGLTRFGYDEAHKDEHCWPDQIRCFDNRTMFPKSISGEILPLDSVRSSKPSQQSTNDNFTANLSQAGYTPCDADVDGKWMGSLSASPHAEDPTSSTQNDWPSRPHEVPRPSNQSVQFFVNSSSPPLTR